ncbi:MAG: hypothetical protein RIS92_1012 [Verrucomicrobiota bacterium]|jgi:phytoene synthase
MGTTNRAGTEIFPALRGRGDADLEDYEREVVARGQGSNLAYVLSVLPRHRRRGMRIFYAFCRDVDDVVDEPGMTDSQRSAALERWERVIRGEQRDAGYLERGVRELVLAEGLDEGWLLGIVDGCRMDLTKRRYETWEALREYCHRVASLVGIVSARLFGAGPEVDDYAVKLGLALQITNILRDVREDWERHGRVYLPSDLLDRHGVREEDIHCFRQTPAFEACAREMAEMGFGYFEAARRALPTRSRGVMVAAEMMRASYQRVLEKIQAGGYRVMEKRFRVPFVERVLLLIGVLLRCAKQP